MKARLILDCPANRRKKMTIYPRIRVTEKDLIEPFVGPTK